MVRGENQDPGRITLEEERNRFQVIYQRRPDDFRNMVKWQAFLLLEKGRETPRRESGREKNPTRKKKIPTRNQWFTYEGKLNFEM